MTFTEIAVGTVVGVWLLLLIGRALGRKWK